ncbi:MAG: acyl-CoA dehydrogenase family protein [Planctomycetota bacterium]|nr:acyl-CoA dehydrogenase family protein [Planctomycetota bacterium]
MDFSLTGEQEALRDTAHRFARDEIAPAARKYDAGDEFPMDICVKAFGIGLMNTVVPDEFGGAGLSRLDEVIITEELAWGCMGITVCLMVNNLAATPLVIAGTPELQKEYLGPLCEEVMFASYCMTEPGAGSDVAGIATTAKKKGDRYVLNGTKRFVTAGGVAKWFIVFAYTDKAKGHKGMSAFVVPKDTPGVTIGKKEDMMGQRASNTAEVIFEEVAVPAGNLLGREGDGFAIAMKTFERSRPGIAAGGVGIGRSAMEQAIAYAKQRRAFGQPIAQFQAIQFMLADMAVDIQAARWLTWHAAWLSDRGKPSNTEASMAKALAADSAMRITTDAVQILGGYGFSREYPVEKMMRDAKVLQIYEGTSQIQRVVIARSLLKD